MKSVLETIRVLRDRVPLSLLEITAVGSIAASALSGKLRLARFGSSEAFWTELRFWATLVALASISSFLSRQREAMNHPTLTFLRLSGLLIAYLIARSAPVAGSLPAIIDCIYLAIQIALLSLIAYRADAIAFLAMVSAAVAGGLFLLALLGVANPELNGPGWAPIGGPITFYRLEFLGFCLAFYWYLARRCPIALVLAIVFFFGTLASLSKMAVIAAYFAVTIILVSHIVRQEWLKASAIAGVVAIASLLWSLHSGHIMNQRVSKALAVTTQMEVRQSGQDLRTTSQPEPSASQPAPQIEVLQPGQDLRLSVQFCRSSNNCVKREIIDRSGRLYMLELAVEGAISSPVFGRGFGQYRIETVGPNQILYYPHNIVAEVMFVGGAIGLAVFLAMLGYAAFSALGAIRRDASTSAIAAFGAFVFLTALASGDFYDLRLFFYAAVILSSPIFQGRNAQA